MHVLNFTVNNVTVHLLLERMSILEKKNIYY